MYYPIISTSMMKKREIHTSMETVLKRAIAQSALSRSSERMQKTLSLEMTAP